MARVVLKALCKQYPKSKGAAVPAVRGIDLTIQDKEFMVFVGPSGCGKSTTLRLIAGLEEITSGSIQIDGREVGHVAPKDRDIAMVFQNYALYPHMSVFENMAFGLKMRGMRREEIETRVRETAVMLGLQDLLERRPKELSGGQRQRVAVGRAIVRQPKVFLFDEPLSNLDAKMRVATRTELVRLHRRLGVTMIYVTHDQVEAMTMGDRICVMRDGSIMQVDTPMALYNRPANLFVAGFIGSPPMNLWSGQLLQEGERLVFTSLESREALRFGLDQRLCGLKGAVKDAALVAGVRPESIRLSREAVSKAMSFPATVERVEAMGAETLVYLNAGSTPVVVRCEPHEQWEVGARVFASFDADKVHLFDRTTEAVLTE